MITHSDLRYIKGSDYLFVKILSLRNYVHIRRKTKNQSSSLFIAPANEVWNKETILLNLTLMWLLTDATKQVISGVVYWVVKLEQVWYFSIEANHLRILYLDGTGRTVEWCVFIELIQVLDMIFLPYLLLKGRFVGIFLLMVL